MCSKALYAGSFDPVTNGHLNIIRRAAKLFDSLTVAVVVNPNKRCLFSVDERKEILAKVTEDIGGVEIDSFEGLLADYVNDKGIHALIRGLRATTDFENELQMAQMNARLFTGDTETIFLMTDPEHSFISSSLIKEVATLGGSIDGLVPPYVEVRVRAKLQEG